MEETLEKLVTKSKESKSSTWKWVLGIVISLVVVFIQWKLKNQATKIASLEAERAVMKEKTVDMAVKLENEKNEARIGVLKDGISDLQAQSAYRAVKLIKLKDAYKEKKASVDKAKKWKELEKLAGRR